MYFVQKPKADYYWPMQLCEDKAPCKKNNSFPMNILFSDETAFNSYVVVNRRNYCV